MDINPTGRLLSEIYHVITILQSDHTLQNENDFIIYSTELLEFVDKIVDRKLKGRGVGESKWRRYYSSSSSS
ncbi:hypothetical protein P5F03_15175, partial [Clostridium perfringens]|nr:hypothetical protein [Clostridium perfringens]